MTAIHETAYPRLKTEYSLEELTAVYTPSSAEIDYVFNLYRQVGPRTFMLVKLKLLQRLGYFVPLASVPDEIIEHICSQANLRKPAKRAITQYDQSGTRALQHQRLRAYLGLQLVDQKAEKWLESAATHAARTKQELPDIINVLIEELVQRKYELPGFTILFRLARRCRNTVNEQIYRSVGGALDKGAIERLDAILSSQQGRSIWDGLKREPKQPNVREVTDFLQHVDKMIEMARGLPSTQQIAATKREQMTLEARALDLAEMRAMKPLKRYTLAVLLIQTQLEKAMDDIADIFIKSLRNLHNTADERLRQYHLQHAEQTERLIGQFREVLSVLNEDGSGDQKLARVDESLHGDYERWINQCDEHMAFAGNNYYPFMLSGYGSKRSLLYKCLEALSLCSSSQDNSLLDAIAFVRKHRTSHRAQLPCAESGIENLDLDWMPDKWHSLVFGKRQNDSEPHFHRKYFELAVFSAVMDELKSGDLYVEHSGEYDDYRSHLVSWDEYENEIQAYGDMVGLPVDPEAFVAELKEQLRSLARLVDQRFPDNGYVDLDQTGIVIRRPERPKPPEGIDTIDQAITSEMSEASILDVLTETEKWLDLHKFFGPLSGFEAKIDDPRKRFITTLFCYGCNLGPVQTARSVKGLSRKQVA